MPIINILRAKQFDEYRLIIDLSSGEDLEGLVDLLNNFVDNGLIFKKDSVLSKSRFHTLNLVPITDIDVMQRLIKKLGFSVKKQVVKEGGMKLLVRKSLLSESKNIDVKKLDGALKKWIALKKEYTDIKDVFDSRIEKLNKKFQLDNADLVAKIAKYESVAMEGFNEMGIKIKQVEEYLVEMKQKPGVPAYSKLFEALMKRIEKDSPALFNEFAAMRDKMKEDKMKEFLVYEGILDVIKDVWNKLKGWFGGITSSLQKCNNILDVIVRGTKK